jgi:hypothetical protein
MAGAGSVPRATPQVGGGTGAGTLPGIRCPHDSTGTVPGTIARDGDAALSQRTRRCGRTRTDTLPGLETQRPSPAIRLDPPRL